MDKFHVTVGNMERLKQAKQQAIAERSVVSYVQDNGCRITIASDGKIVKVSWESKTGKRILELE